MLFVPVALRMRSDRHSVPFSEPISSFEQAPNRSSKASKDNTFFVFKILVFEKQMYALNFIMHEIFP